jgi:hypothetical protein
VLALDAPVHMARLDQLLEAPLGPDRETWGLGSQAAEGTHAMEALVGGPARPRS